MGNDVGNGDDGSSIAGNDTGKGDGRDAGGEGGGLLAEDAAAAAAAAVAAAAAAATAATLMAAAAAYCRVCLLFIVKIFLCGMFMMVGGIGEVTPPLTLSSRLRNVGVLLGGDGNCPQKLW